MEFLREMPENSHLLCGNHASSLVTLLALRNLLTFCVFLLPAEPYFLLKCVFLGPSLDNSPSSDSERTYLWSPSKDPPHSFLSVAPCTTPCLSTLLHQLLDKTIVTHRAFLAHSLSANLSLHRCRCFPCSQIQPQPPKTSLKFPDQTMFPTPHYWWLVPFPAVHCSISGHRVGYSLVTRSPGHQRTLCNQADGSKEKDRADPGID
ncbi:uncharacterized protein LOC124866149 [Girardinichthys multiradiatus]|uniref:uncharacterized protein LOC124866149 n=1 Tax=Girardinichthys multiradiatus TaxID=208333 RepID=UPI001FAC6FA7|nr:uncharacterized protein LOC124866149 [Girardinichthys multiradiatus]